MPPASSLFAERPVPAPPPMMGSPRATCSRNRLRMLCLELSIDTMRSSIGAPGGVGCPGRPPVPPSIDKERQPRVGRAASAPCRQSRSIELELDHGLTESSAPAADRGRSESRGCSASCGPGSAELHAGPDGELEQLAAKRRRGDRPGVTPRFTETGRGPSRTCSRRLPFCEAVASGLGTARAAASDGSATSASVFNSHRDTPTHRAHRP